MPNEIYPFISPPHQPKEVCKNAWLPVVVTNPVTGESLFSYGLIDTGAFDVAVPGFLAEQIGINVTDGQKIDSGTAGGTIKVYLHDLNIEIFGFKIDKGKFQITNQIHSAINASIGCCPDLKTLLLGRFNFLDHFILSINYLDQNFPLTK